MPKPVNEKSLVLVNGHQAKAEGVGSGVFNLSHSGLISRFLAYPFPFRDWLP